MSELTPAQIKVIEVWTEKRDSLLKEIGVLQTDANELIKGNNQKSLSYSDLEKRISESRGRLAELDALEIRYKNSMSVEVATLEAQKSRLEEECKAKAAILADAESKLALILKVTQEFEDAHLLMKDQAKIVNEVVGGIIKTSQVHTSDMQVIMSEIKTIASDVIEKGNKNVEQTNIVLSKVNKLIFEMQRPLPVRRRPVVTEQEKK